MTTIYKPLFRGAVPASKDYLGATALYTVPTTTPATSTVLKNVTLGNVANGIPVGFVYAAGGSFWTSSGFNGSTTTNTTTVSDTPCADQGPDGTIFFGSRAAIMKMDIAGNVSLLAGQGMSFVHADGTGAAAGFQGITDLVVDSTGTNLYVCDGFYVRKVVIATGVVTTIAGNGTQGQTTNATGTSANIEASSLCIAPDDSALYLVPLTGKDNSNTGAIVKVALTGSFAVTNVVTSAIANTTSSTGMAPNRIAINSAGNTLYFTDCLNNGAASGGALKKVATTGGTITSLLTGQPAGLCALAVDWSDNDSLLFCQAGSSVSKIENVNGTLLSGIIRVLLGNLSPGWGISDGTPGTGLFANTLASIRIRGRYAVITTFSVAQVTGQSIGIYRVHLTDGFLQCIAGTSANTTWSTASNQNIYGNCKAAIRMPVHVKLWVVPSGQTPGDAYQLGKLLTVAAGETLSLDLNISMSQGDSLWAESLTPGATINASGLEVA